MISAVPSSSNTTTCTSEWAAWNQRQLDSYRPKHVPAEERESYAASTSLRQFYQHCDPEFGHWTPIGRSPKRSKGTAQKDRQSINRWEQYTIPADWTGGPWPGPSLSFLEQVGEMYFSELWERMKAGGLAHDTVKSTRSHLQGIIRHAHRVGAILKIPYHHSLGKKDPKTRIYTPTEVRMILDKLVSFPRLEAAFQLVLDCGPRAVDNFCLRWSDIVDDHMGRKMILFESRKTHKLQGVPLSKAAWNLIKELPRESELVFGDYGNPNAEDPEKSYQARLRNTLFKSIIKSIGIGDVQKPWQVARSTCNERYESHRPGTGLFICGHALSGVNARSYRQPTEAVHEAVRTLPPYTQLERQQRLFH